MEHDRPQHGHRQVERGQVPLDPQLALEVRDAGVAVGAADRAVDEVPHPGPDGGVGHRPALALLGLDAAGAAEGLDAEHPVDALHRREQRRLVVQVAAYEDRARLLELPCLFLARVADQGVHGVSAPQQFAGHRPALPAGTAQHQDRSFNRHCLPPCRVPRRGFSARLR